MKNINNNDASKENGLKNALKILSLPFTGMKKYIRQIVCNIGPFNAFCTCILEKDGKVASVATFRVHNTDNIAEILFVATHEHHRGRGACKILMNNLEHSLKQLKVQHILLPSRQDVKHMWQHYLVLNTLMTTN
jgi:ribosomal protein S18 acetylase RimI-like enzyme